MAFKFVVSLALFAVCHAGPVIRNARSYTLGEGFSSGYGGLNQASAAVSGGNAQAYGINNNGANIARDGLGNGLPGQAFAKAGTYDTPDSGIGRAHPVYYPIPAPATVLTYQQYADVPETPSQIVYEVPQAPALAQSSAVTNGGYGSAASNADTGLGHAASNARTQGSGYGTASSIAQTNGIAPVPATEDIESVNVAKNQGLHTVYTPVQPAGYASSNANVNGHYGSAASSAKTGAVPTRKSISWRFGTAYDGPATYTRSAANNVAYGAANADAGVNSGLESVRSTANSQGAGSARSDAKTGAGYGFVNSAANSFGGNANANADINNAGYATLRSGEGYGIGYGAIKSTANANGHGSANSNADIDAAGHGHAKSAANSQGVGSAQSSANTAGYGHALRSAGWGSRTATDADANGYGNAQSSAQNLSTEYRVNSAANSHGWGSARANAHSG